MPTRRLELAVHAGDLPDPPGRFRRVDMLVDVEVISGSGRVVPFVQSVDGGSGDTIVRAE